MNKIWTINIKDLIPANKDDFFKKTFPLDNETVLQPVGVMINIRIQFCNHSVKP